MARRSRAWAATAAGTITLATMLGGVSVSAASDQPGESPERASRCDITGTPGNDILTGTRAGETICGGRGDDVVYARGGRDLVRGGPGSDILIGGRGSDRLRGGSGNDLVVALGGGRDRVRCGAGRDDARVGGRDRTHSCESRSSQPFDRTKQPSPSPDPTSPPEPQGCDATSLGSLRAPGCKELFADTARTQDPKPIWGTIDCEKETRISWRAGGADPHPAATGAGQGDDRYRRFTVHDGDDVWGQRCEVGKNDHRTGPVTLYREGTRRVSFMSFRLPEAFPLGVSTWQVLMQMKQTQPSANGGGTPVLALNAFDGRWQLRQSLSSGPSSDTRQIWSAPAKTGVWTRFAFDITYSQDPRKGSIRVYADLNGDGDTDDSSEQSSRIETYTLKRETTGGTDDGIAPGESIPSHLRVGIYSNPIIPCLPIVSGGCNVDVDNVQVVRVP